MHARHVMPTRGEHIAHPECWCSPRGERVRDPWGVVVGIVWTHRAMQTAYRGGNMRRGESNTRWGDGT